MIIAAEAKHAARRKRTLDRAKKVAGQLVPHTILIILSLGAVLPFIWMLFASFKPFKELVNSLDLLPHVWTLDSYRQILFRVNFLVAFRNNIILSGTITLAILVTSAACGYVFAKYRFWGKESLFTVLLATMMVPFAVVMVPLYIIVASLRMVDQLTAVIVPSLWSTFGLFMLRQFIETIPDELLDAARIDGSSEWFSFSKIVLPLAGAPLSALAVFAFLGQWDNFLWPTIVLNSPAKQNLPQLLAGLRSYYWTSYDLWMAGSMLTVIPVMIVYAFASKYMIKGIAMSGLKL
jgi:multiple sugar transport system permease protein